jgi:hypothetical protein
MGFVGRPDRTLFKFSGGVLAGMSLHPETCLRALQGVV